MSRTTPPEFSRNWGTECLNTRFPLPTLQCAGYRVKLILFDFICIKILLEISSMFKVKLKRKIVMKEKFEVILGRLVAAPTVAKAGNNDVRRTTP